MPVPDAITPCQGYDLCIDLRYSTNKECLTKDNQHTLSYINQCGLQVDKDERPGPTSHFNREKARGKFVSSSCLTSSDRICRKVLLRDLVKFAIF